MKALPSSVKKIDQVNKQIAYLTSIVKKSASSLWLVEYPFIQCQNPYAKLKLVVIGNRIWIWMLLIIISVKDHDSISFIQYRSLARQ